MAQQCPQGLVASINVLGGVVLPQLALVGSGAEANFLDQWKCRQECLEQHKKPKCVFAFHLLAHVTHRNQPLTMIIFGDQCELLNISIISNFTPHTSKKPSAYHNLGKVFSKVKALFLPLCCPNCVINLLPGSPCLSRHLCNLSIPERKSMKR